MFSSIKRLLAVSYALTAGASIIVLSLVFLECFQHDADFWNSFANARMTALIVVLVMAAACAGLSYRATRAIADPIADLVKTMRRLASGEFSARAEPGRVREFSDMAEDLNRLASKLQSLEMVYTDFVANASHELRSPVSNIRITSEVLERRAERLGDDASRLFQVIVAETERLEHMIDELMELSAIESGALVLEKQPFNVRALIEELTGTLQPRTEHKGLTIGLLADPDLHIVADRERLARALTNLIDNAVKFTPEGGQIVVTARKTADCVAIEVSDTGDGIPAAELPRLFERFYRADKARRREGGTGIGLPIVKSIVEAHNGVVDVHSEEGAGSRFRIKLPIDVVVPEDEAMAHDLGPCGP